MTTLIKSYDNPYTGINEASWIPEGRNRALDALEGHPQLGAANRSLNETYDNMAALRGRAKRLGQAYQACHTIAKVIGTLSTVAALAAIPTLGLGASLIFSTAALTAYVAYRILKFAVEVTDSGLDVREHSLRSIRFALWLGADPNKINPQRSTPLTQAVYSGRSNTEEIIRLLLKHGACVNLPDAYGGTPLFNAVNHEKVALISILLEAGAYINLYADRHNPPLKLAGGCDKIVDMLLKSENIYPKAIGEN